MKKYLWLLLLVSISLESYGQVGTISKTAAKEIAKRIGKKASKNAGRKAGKNVGKKTTIKNGKKGIQTVRKGGNAVAKPLKSISKQEAIQITEALQKKYHNIKLNAESVTKVHDYCVKNGFSSKSRDGIIKELNENVKELLKEKDLLSRPGPLSKSKKIRLDDLKGMFLKDGITLSPQAVEKEIDRLCRATIGNDKAISPERFAHIVFRHTKTSFHKSNFNQNFSKDLYKNICDIAKDKKNFVTTSGDRHVYIKRFSKPIGYGTNGEELYYSKVILEPDGSVVTAYPISSKDAKFALRKASRVKTKKVAGEVLDKAVPIGVAGSVVYSELSDKKSDSEE